MTVNPILLAAISTIAGIFLRVLFEHFREKHRFKKELKDNNYIDVSAEDWHAAWQTCVDGQVLINTERLSMKQKGGVVQVKNIEKSPENPKGGYLWESQMQFFQGRFLMGWYFPLRAENNASKGIMFWAYHSPKKIFYGKWVGSAYDGDLASGFVVISKDRTNSLGELSKLMAKHTGEVNIILSQI